MHSKPSRGDCGRFRCAQAITSKERKIPAVKAWQRRRFTPDRWRPGQNTGLGLGKQQNGLHLYYADIDSHSGKQDAPTFLRGVLNTIPRDLTDKLFTARSTGGAGQYIMFYTRHELPNGLLYDRFGNKAGEPHVRAAEQPYVGCAPRAATIALHVGLCWR